MSIDAEIILLKEHITRLGAPLSDGRTAVKFGVLVRDPIASNVFEALNNVLRTAKKRKVITFDGEMLLQGAHDQVDVILL